MTNGTTLTARASVAAHHLVGWTFWDPGAIESYAALGVPEGRGYYVATRAAPLAAAGDEAVIASFVSIHPGLIRFSLDQCRRHTTFADAYRVRNEAAAAGLHRLVPEIVQPLASMAPALWDAVDRHPLDGRVLFAAHAAWPRGVDDPLTSAWLAINCLREWRGDTHWAVVTAAGLDGVAAGLLHDAYMGYPGEWLPRSRGADDTMIERAWADLVDRGLAETNGNARRVNDAGIALRERIEAQTDDLCARSWRLLGEEHTVTLCELVEPFEHRFIDAVDTTAGPNYMPAVRPRRPRA
jgi:hypothetical protein